LRSHNGIGLAGTRQCCISRKRDGRVGDPAKALS
jgi:hypothetical protein